MMNKLTVIIPFLNEGEEVENTLISINTFSLGKVDIIVINDCSDDTYNYDRLVECYNITYVKNKVRLGVAASRDLGVEICQTPYFLLLDAHMRFYNEAWVNVIVSELKNNKRGILCCQTKALYKENGIIIEKTAREKSVGAYINFDWWGEMLEVKWNFQTKSEQDIERIPCILGAAYAADKQYWRYLKGLTGLQSYGSDEIYISIKVWQEGGQCKLLNQVIIGHIYRPLFPYNVDKTDIVYNKLLVASMFLPEKICFLAFENIKKRYLPWYIKAFQKWQKTQNKIEELKGYYEKIFTRNFNFILELNLEKKLLPSNQDEILLNQLVSRILLQVNCQTNIGFLQGQMGIVVFLYHYAQHIGNDFFRIFADRLLNLVYTHLDFELPVNFDYGLCGIGWGLEYLFRNNFIKNSYSEVLLNIDKKVMEKNPLRINDWSLESGLGGILQYVISRLNTAQIGRVNHGFDQNYLINLNTAALRIISNENNGECMAIALQYYQYFSIDIESLYTWELKDFIRYPSIERENWNKLELGIYNGCAGVGLRIMNI